MPLSRIAESLQKGMPPQGLPSSIKFDCGADGVLVLTGAQVLRDDQPTDCTIRISADNLDKLLRGKLNPMTGVMMGKLKLSGDATAALQLSKLLKS
ncbi:SCP2 sterol-binding domain-containing protein [Oceanomicrobium pacificus]|uniref:Sterol carrier protein n=1 Tax=Oceanomicrobium pacificus TaxID=2692916 RepID=A0A6B0TSS8_9RHOB|nr:SCP2 sterol-binding domain-containing protein [Oceanomicrobium pacificus]MXU64053.1 sterol carrier protein [Oceanomicrobium pacificus]